MNLKRNLLFFGLLAMVFLSACSNSDSGSARTMKPNGISQTLTKRPGDPLWIIDSVGDNNKVWESKVFELPPHRQLVVIGWALDEESKKAAGGVEMVIDGAPYSAQYGVSRTDVARFFATPAYADSGYILKLPADQFAAGSHTLSVRVLSNDRLRYKEAGPYPLNVK